MLLSLLTATLLAPTPSQEPPPAVDPTVKLARDSNAFAFDLYARMRETPGNLVFSPASIAVALEMTWAGARGETAEQMRRVLHLEGTPQEVLAAAGKQIAALQAPDRGIVFRIANQLFGEQTFAFERPFLDQTRAAFGASLEPLDFRGAPDASRKRINAWVEKQTEDRIRDLLPQGAVAVDTRLVLVNAIYFLGDWAVPFEKERTRPAPFFTSKSEKKDVATMNRTGSIGYARGPGWSAIELPYEGESMSMLIVLPDAVDGLAEVERSIDAAKLEELVARLAPVRVRASLPRFEVNPERSLPLKPELEALGMPLAFERKLADLTGIANPPDPDQRLFIGNVFHKAFVKVDEKGTEAAAATAVVVALTASIPADPVEFKADHPFLFFVRDQQTGLVLFMGRVVDPG